MPIALSQLDLWRNSLQLRGVLEGIYLQNGIDLELRRSLAKWVTGQGESWFRITSKTFPQCGEIVKRAAAYLSNDENNSSHCVSIRQLQNLARDVNKAGAFISAFKHCLFEEAREFDNYFVNPLFNGAIRGHVTFETDTSFENAVDFLAQRSSALAESLSNFELSLRRPLDLTDQSGITRTQLISCAANYQPVVLKCRSTITNYLHLFNRQMAHMSFSELMTTSLDHLQGAYDAAAQLIIQDLARVECGLGYARNNADEELIQSLEGLRTVQLDFLTNFLVKNCLALEKQMAQIVRKGSNDNTGRFNFTPTLRMLCPSIIFCRDSLAQKYSAFNSEIEARHLVNWTSYLIDETVWNCSVPYAAAQRLDIEQYEMVVKSNVFQLTTADFKKDQDFIAQGNNFCGAHEMLVTPTKSVKLESPGRSQSAGASKRATTETETWIVAKNAKVDIYFVDEGLASHFTPAMRGVNPIKTVNLIFNPLRNRAIAAIDKLYLRNYQRERSNPIVTGGPELAAASGPRPPHRVVEEKSCLLFNCCIPPGGYLFRNQNLEQHVAINSTTVATALSFPIVVTVHNNQISNAMITILWDNFFADFGRNPFQVADTAKWYNLKRMLNGYWRWACGSDLRPENIHLLAERLFDETRTSCPFALPHLDTPNMQFDTCQCFDDSLVSWKRFTKDKMHVREKASGASLKKGGKRPTLALKFSFWEWFYSYVKLVATSLKPFWYEGLICWLDLFPKNIQRMLFFTARQEQFSLTELGKVAFPYCSEVSGANVINAYKNSTLQPSSDATLFPRLICDVQRLKIFWPLMRSKYDFLSSLFDALPADPGDGYKPLKWVGIDADDREMK